MGREANPEIHSFSRRCCLHQDIPDPLMSRFTKDFLRWHPFPVAVGWSGFLGVVISLHWQACVQPHLALGWDTGVRGSFHSWRENVEQVLERVPEFCPCTAPSPTVPPPHPFHAGCPLYESSHDAVGEHGFPWFLWFVISWLFLCVPLFHVLFVKKSRKEHISAGHCSHADR